MTLIINGERHRIAQMGPDFIILETPANHPPANAEITLDIDGTKRNWIVYLPKGLPLNKTRIPIAKVN